MKYLLLFLLPFSLYASKILSYNIYERSNRADVMITFDTPFSGVIKQSKSTNKIIIKLQGASIESSRSKRVNSDFLHSLTITPLKGQTQIVASISPNVRLIASKTSDAYGLRLRFTDAVAIQQTAKNPSSTNALSALPTKKDGEMSTSYYIVVGILIFGIIILLVLKKKMISQTNTKKSDSWLFNSNDTKIQEETKVTTPTDVKSSDSMVSIRFQKSIDNYNSVVMLDFGNESYLVLMGNSNILLDKFKENKPSSQQEFDSILQERNQELEDFLGANEGHETYSVNHAKEPLQAYKERAASLIYADEA
ncbi:hypothetical protein JHD47_02700 [Sulfurimonas sp. SAG-AH-194-L11]|nr:hypothetical protein [Sulfurimonas sp. SAG-AH-194-L11]MDF1876721.1 hypothetical protein [Sulfurimonas sp. SAG-AH-194-L11]